jgi:hypothetical protein
MRQRNDNSNGSLFFDNSVLYHYRYLYGFYGRENDKENVGREVAGVERTA